VGTDRPLSPSPPADPLTGLLPESLLREDDPRAEAARAWLRKLLTSGERASGQVSQAMLPAAAGREVTA
jgi:hypothetical protein